MRIGFDARYAGDPFPGIGRYSLGLVQALAELQFDHHLIVFQHDPGRSTPYRLEAFAQIPGIELVSVRSGPFSAGQQVELPLLARRLRLDLLHSPYLIKPYLLPCPSIVTIFDLLGSHFPQTLSPRGRRFYRIALRLAVWSSTAIVTMSQHAREDIVHLSGVPRGRVTVTVGAAMGHFKPQSLDTVAAVQRRYDLPERYILYLGSSKPHKNLERLLRAWERILADDRYQQARAGVVLVIAGPSDPQRAALQRFAGERELDAHVRFLPSITEVDLAALYSGALFFVFPSYYEGFGLPPLEAMACGTPVLCAYAASLPEVVGEAALTVDPFNVHEIAEGMGRLLTNPSLRRQLSASGLQRARRFSWRRTAFETLAVYEQTARSS
jgi:glycosyltransferase involved in cell wall biosynthesis